jgi:hypothetical protein
MRMTMSTRQTTTDCRYTEEDHQLLNAQAVLAWAQFTANEKALVRFGMFPADRMAALEALFPEMLSRDRSRLLAVALMDCARKDGGMRA